jgi:prepilin-type N-terminal cleavage/methylation domain-containing protein
MRTLRRYRGFTILELLVVIAVMVLLAGILITFYGQARRSQGRYRTMSNMRLIYNGLRQYQLDENGLPPFDPRAAEAFHTYQTGGALPLPGPATYYPWYGLWALVETRALESPIPLHDGEAKRVCVQSTGAADFATAGRMAPIEDAFFWCSYQTWDPQASQGTGAWMYLPYRGDSTTLGPVNYRRQGWPYPDGTGQSRWMPLDSTVLLWSRWHRDGKNPVTPVLFMNGSVQYKESFTQDASSPFIAENAP